MQPPEFFIACYIWKTYPLRKFNKDGTKPMRISRLAGLINQADSTTRGQKS